MTEMTRARMIETVGRRVFSRVYTLDEGRLVDLLPASNLPDSDDLFWAYPVDPTPQEEAAMNSVGYLVGTGEFEVLGTVERDLDD